MDKSQICPGGNAAVSANHDDLSVQHIRVGEGVVVLTTLHGEAVPNAVDGPGIHQGVLGLPVDRLQLDLPVELVGDRTGEVEVEAGVLAVVTHIAVGRIRLVETDDQLGCRCGGGVLRRLRGGPGIGRLGSCAASREQRQRHNGGRRAGYQRPPRHAAFSRGPGPNGARLGHSAGDAREVALHVLLVLLHDLFPSFHFT